MEDLQIPVARVPETEGPLVRTRKELYLSVKKSTTPRYLDYEEKIQKQLIDWFNLTPGQTRNPAFVEFVDYFFRETLNHWNRYKGRENNFLKRHRIFYEKSIDFWDLEDIEAEAPGILFSTDRVRRNGTLGL